MTQTILITLICLAVLMAALRGMALFGSAYGSDQQLTLLGLSLLTGAAANALGYWALSR